MENSNSNSSKPPRNRNRNRMILEGGVVGLGIVAAMSITNINNSTATATHADIVSSAKPAANFPGATTNGLFSASPLNVGFGTHFLSHFLNSCNLCDKRLHGIDIFIYRGERAFCSAECRVTHIRIDDYQEKSRSSVLKPLDCSTPPCSGPPVSLAGIVAA